MWSENTNAFKKLTSTQRDREKKRMQGTFNFSILRVSKLQDRFEMVLGGLSLGKSISPPK